MMQFDKHIYFHLMKNILQKIKYNQLTKLFLLSKNPAHKHMKWIIVPKRLRKRNTSNNETLRNLL